MKPGTQNNALLTPLLPGGRVLPGPPVQKQSPNPNLRLVSAKQFAEALWDVLQIKMTPNKAWRWRREGLPHWPVRPRTFRYDIAEGIEWFLRCGKVAENLEASVNQARYMHLLRLDRGRRSPSLIRG